MTRMITLGTCFLILTCMVACLPVSSTKVSAYNNEVADILMDFDRDFQALNPDLNEAFVDQTPDTTQLRKQIEQLNARIDNHLEQLDNLEVPDSDPCRAYHDATRSYLAHFQTYVTKQESTLDYFDTVPHAYMVDWDRINDSVAEWQAEELRLVKAMEQAQFTMADQHDFELVPRDRTPPAE